MKGLILAGGSGRRLRPLTHTSAKQLVPIANKPILHYVVEDLVGVGVTDLGIVVGETAAEIRASVGDGSRWGATVTYIEQSAPLGLAHAVVEAGGFLRDGPFVMYLGDNMFEDSLEAVVEGFAEGGGVSARLLLSRVDDPSSFGVAELGDDGSISQLVEKPENPNSDLALVGVYLFGSAIHEAVRSIQPSERGELEITDAISWLLERGDTVEHRLLVLERAIHMPARRPLHARQFAAQPHEAEPVFHRSLERLRYFAHRQRLGVVACVGLRYQARII